MYRPINWVIVGLFLCLYVAGMSVLGLSLRGRSAAAAAPRPSVEVAQASLPALAANSGSLTFGRIPADSPEKDSSLLVRRRPDGFAFARAPASDVTPAVVSYEAELAVETREVVRSTSGPLHEAFVAHLD